MEVVSLDSGNHEPHDRVKLLGIRPDVQGLGRQESGQGPAAVGGAAGEREHLAPQADDDDAVESVLLAVGVAGALPDIAHGPEEVGGRVLPAVVAGLEGEDHHFVGPAAAAAAPGAAPGAAVSVSLEEGDHEVAVIVHDRWVHAVPARLDGVGAGAEIMEEDLLPHGVDVEAIRVGDLSRCMNCPSEG